MELFKVLGYRIMGTEKERGSTKNTFHTPTPIIKYTRLYIDTTRTPLFYNTYNCHI